MTARRQVNLIEKYSNGSAGISVRHYRAACPGAGAACVAWVGVCSGRMIGIAGALAPPPSMNCGTWPFPPQLRLGVDLTDVVVGPAGRFDAGARGGRIAFAAQAQPFCVGLGLEEIAFGVRACAG
jgi:hypothetical protein